MYLLSYLIVPVVNVILERCALSVHAFSSQLFSYHK